MNAEIDQYKDILKKFKDYDEEILKERMRNAEKDREAMKLRVSARDSNSSYLRYYPEMLFAALQFYTFRS